MSLGGDNLLNCASRLCFRKELSQLSIDLARVLTHSKVRCLCHTKVCVDKLGQSSSGTVGQHPVVATVRDQFGERAVSDASVVGTADIVSQGLWKERERRVETCVHVVASK